MRTCQNGHATPLDCNEFRVFEFCTPSKSPFILLDIVVKVSFYSKMFIGGYYLAIKRPCNFISHIEINLYC